MKKSLIALLTLSLCLTACGHTREDRALSGAAIGATAGAVGGIIIGGDPVTGAAIGGAVGAVTGAIADETEIDLGEPLWK